MGDGPRTCNLRVGAFGGSVLGGCADSPFDRKPTSQQAGAADDWPQGWTRRFGVGDARSQSPHRDLEAYRQALARRIATPAKPAAAPPKAKPQKPPRKPPKPFNPPRPAPGTKGQKGPGKGKGGRPAVANAPRGATGATGVSGATGPGGKPPKTSLWGVIVPPLVAFGVLGVGVYVWARYLREKPGAARLRTTTVPPVRTRLEMEAQAAEARAQAEAQARAEAEAQAQAEAQAEADALALAEAEASAAAQAPPTLTLAQIKNALARSYSTMTAEQHLQTHVAIHEVLKTHGFYKDLTVEKQHDLDARLASGREISTKDSEISVTYRQEGKELFADLSKEESLLVSVPLELPRDQAAVEQLRLLREAIGHQIEVVRSAGGRQRFSIPDAEGNPVEYELDFRQILPGSMAPEYKPFVDYCVESLAFRAAISGNPALADDPTWVRDQWVNVIISLRLLKTGGKTGEPVFLDEGELQKLLHGTPTPETLPESPVSDVRGVIVEPLAPGEKPAAPVPLTGGTPSRRDMPSPGAAVKLPPTPLDAKPAAAKPAGTPPPIPPAKTAVDLGLGIPRIPTKELLEGVKMAARSAKPPAPVAPAAPAAPMSPTITSPADDGVSASVLRDVLRGAPVPPPSPTAPKPPAAEGPPELSSPSLEALAQEILGFSDPKAFLEGILPGENADASLLFVHNALEGPKVLNAIEEKLTPLAVERGSVIASMRINRRERVEVSALTPGDPLTPEEENEVKRSLREQVPAYKEFIGRPEAEQEVLMELNRGGFLKRVLAQEDVAKREEWLRTLGASVARALRHRIESEETRLGLLPSDPVRAEKMARARERLPEGAPTLAILEEALGDPFARPDDAPLPTLDELDPQVRDVQEMMRLFEVLRAFGAQKWFISLNSDEAKMNALMRALTIGDGEELAPGVRAQLQEDGRIGFADLHGEDSVLFINSLVEESRTATLYEECKKLEQEILNLADAERPGQHQWARDNAWELARVITFNQYFKSGIDWRRIEEPFVSTEPSQRTAWIINILQKIGGREVTLFDPEGGRKYVEAAPPLPPANVSEGQTKAGAPQPKAPPKVDLEKFKRLTRSFDLLLQGNQAALAQEGITFATDQARTDAAGKIAYRLLTDAKAREEFCDAKNVFLLEKLPEIARRVVLRLPPPPPPRSAVAGAPTPPPKAAEAPPAAPGEEPGIDGFRERLEAAGIEVATPAREPAPPTSEEVRVLYVLQVKRPSFAELPVEDQKQLAREIVESPYLDEDLRALLDGQDVGKELKPFLEEKESASRARRGVGAGVAAEGKREGDLDAESTKNARPPTAPFKK